MHFMVTFYAYVFSLCSFLEIFTAIKGLKQMGRFARNRLRKKEAFLLKADFMCQFQIHFLHTAQKMKFSIKDFFSKRDQIRRKLRIWSHLLNKSLMENFIFCSVITLILKMI